MASSTEPDAFRSSLSLFILISRCVIHCYNETDAFTDGVTNHPFARSSMLPNESSESSHSSQSIHLNESAASTRENDLDDGGKLAGIIIGILIAIVATFSMVAFFMYRQCNKRNITSMNFDNPVYRKTTEDQFSLEKNQYHPAGSYPPSLEPLTSPGTNEFV